MHRLARTLGSTEKEVHAPYREWPGEPGGDYDAVAESLLDAIRRVGLPFLEKYRNLENVRAALLSENPDD